MLLLIIHDLVWCIGATLDGLGQTVVAAYQVRAAVSPIKMLMMIVTEFEKLATLTQSHCVCNQFMIGTLILLTHA